MKPQTSFPPIAFPLIAVLIFLSTCKPERVWDNPYDTETSLSPNAWAPTNLQLTPNSLTSLTLSWTSTQTHFDGFKIDRKVGSGQWEVGIATLETTTKTFTDTQVDLTANGYTYKVYAYADKNSSATLEKQIQPTLLTTTEVNNITYSTAKSGGTASSDPLLPITARGVVWSTIQNPTIPVKEGSQNELLNDTLKTKSDTIVNKPNKKFQNSKITTPDTTSKVSSKPITTLTQNGGYTTDGSGSGTWTSDISALLPSTTYYVRAYSTNSAGTVYGAERSFTTVAPTLPILSTNSVTSITATSAICGGNITLNGGAEITARGVVWSTSQNPTIASNQGITNNGTGLGSFTSNLTNLTVNTTYYIRSYATNAVGTSYGNQQTFTTLDGLPVLSTTTVTSITSTTAISGGNITADGGFAVTARGVVWSTSQNPTTTANLGITSNGTGIGSFTSNLSNLTVTIVR